MIKNSCCCVIHVNRTECRIEEERSARTGAYVFDQMAALSVIVIALVFAVLHYCWQLAIYPFIHLCIISSTISNTHLITYLRQKYRKLEKMLTGFTDYYIENNWNSQCQVPMFVATKLAKIKAASLFVASPSAYARSAVAAIGYEVHYITVLYSSLLYYTILYYT